MSTAIRPRGYTLIETAIAMAVLGVLFAAFSQAFVTSSELASRSRVRTRAESSLRQGLAALAAQVRRAELDSAVGFDEAGRAYTLSFRTVGDHDGADRIRSALHLLEWRPRAGQRFGDVVLVHEDGRTECLAREVPAGGFSLERAGNEVRIQLTGYGAPLLRASIAVAPRN